MPEKHLKVGIVGSGGIGYTHLEALRRIGDVDIVALCRSNLSAAQSDADRYSVPKVYADYKQLIDDPEIEMVVIATPNSLHFEHVTYALNAGKHVSCDKPLGINVAQTGTMWELARKKNVVHAISYNHRFLPLVYQAREMIRKGDLGDLTFTRAYSMGDFMYSIGMLLPNHWRMSPETVGLSKVMSVYGGHLLDMIQFISGLRVKKVFADFGYIDPLSKGITFDGANYVKEAGGQLEDYANLLLRFDNGVKGVVILNEAAPGHKTEVSWEFVGKKSSVAWNLQKINEIWIGFRDQPNQVLYKGFDLLYPEAQEVAAPPAWGQDGFSESFRMYYAAVCRFILEGKLKQGVQPEFATFEDGHYTELILQAMLNSVKHERWQNVG